MMMEVDGTRQETSVEDPTGLSRMTCKFFYPVSGGCTT